LRFGYTQEANCTYCYEPQQTIEHLFTECGRTEILFKNFEKHYKLDTELTWCEKMIGIDMYPDKKDAQEAGHPEEADLQLQP
jgi:hypothetical protein